MTQPTAAEMRSLADAFRKAAANPVQTTMPARWVEGFTDGLRFSAAALDVIASGKPTGDAIEAALQAIDA